jgi:AraC-like DNA-binding protein
MLTNSSPTNVEPYRLFDRSFFRSSQVDRLSPSDRRSGPADGRKDGTTPEVRLLQKHPKAGAIDCAVRIAPSHAVKRSAATWDGMMAEVVQATTHQSIEYRFCAPHHLLVVYEQGVRRDGDTFVEGLPRSTLRDFRRKLTFVPADHEYHELHEPRVLTRLAYFYLDPERLPTLSEASRPLAPRVFFEDATLWDTAFKLKQLIETPGSHNRLYFEALGVVLAHELVRVNAGTRSIEAPARGGLAPWQQRIVTTYIEEHLAEQIPLATLAGLVRLSPYYFCRAFKQSFGLPPHRYHNRRRIEQAKLLLAKPAPSVTDIGMTIGFSETSSFTTAFRKATGMTPTAYHRSVA